MIRPPGRQSGGVERGETGFPPFEPHPLVRGGHAQTLAGRYLPARRVRLVSTYHEVSLDDMDHSSVLESVPEGWGPRAGSALLVHGLAGCARSPYVVRVAARLFRRGIRVVRMNLRGAGSGFGASRRFYHGGRSDDLRQVVRWMTRRGGSSPVALIGFSLGGNLVLKLAAEAAGEPLEGLDCVLAANPPLDLAACCGHLRRRGRLYDRNFVRLLGREVRRLHQRYPDDRFPDLSGVRSVYDFDDTYTAPCNGFAGADDYYRRCSAGPLLARVTVPGLIVHAEDDPFIPAGPICDVTRPATLALELVRSGGHLGYVSKAPLDGDHRWLDARLAAWLAARWGLGSAHRWIPGTDLAAGDRSSGGFLS